MWCHNTNHYGNTDSLSYDGLYCFVKSTLGLVNKIPVWLRFWATYKSCPVVRIFLLSQALLVAWSRRKLFHSDHALTNLIFTCHQFCYLFSMKDVFIQAVNWFAQFNNSCVLWENKVVSRIHTPCHRPTSQYAKQGSGFQFCPWMICTQSSKTYKLLFNFMLNKSWLYQ